MKNSFFIGLSIVLEILFLTCFSIESKGQNHKFDIKGTIVGENLEPLTGATIVLVNAQDSVLASYGISDEKGHFSLRKIKPGEYVLQATFVGYENFSESITLQNDDPEKIKTKEIKLTPSLNLLDQVEVKDDHIPIRIKGDTIEYNAAAFKTQPNAVVEDLLKQLPGVDVDRDGNVKAQGKDVEHIYVDGKEFFGDDPKMATKNLPADAIDKVQVFDKQSDMAEFTGIDDGQREKTINLSLKEDKKNGVFGNVTGGYGTNDRFEAKANINHFNKKMQLSALGIANNINEQGFSIQDYIEFMGGLANLMSGGGGTMRMSLNSEDSGVPLGNNLNNGIVKTGAGGVNFNYDFNKKTKLSSSYFFNGIINSIEQEINRQNFLPDGESYNSEQFNDLVNKNASHRLNLNFEHEIDSSQSIKFRSNFSFSDGNSLSDNLSETYNVEGALENSSLRKYDTDSQRFRLNSSLLYRKRFQKMGRVFVTDLSFGMNNNDRDAGLSAINSFYPALPTPSHSDTILQHQTLKSDQLNFRAKVSYIEPLGNRKYLEFNYAFSNRSDDEQKNVYDVLTEPKGEEAFNSLLSNHFANDYFYNTGGLNFKFNRKKYQWTAGLSLQQSQLNGNLISADTTLKRSFLNVLPSLNLNYDISNSKNFSLQYLTNIREPSITQLNPVIDNSDPLNLYVGNPALKPEYVQSLNLNFSSFDQFSFTNIFVYLNTTYTRNKIYNARNIDSLYRQVIHPINVKDDLLINSYLTFGTPLRFMKSRINLTINSMYNNGIDIINEVENNTNRLINTFDISLENRKKEIVDILVGGKVTHNLTKYSKNSDYNQSFFDQTYYGDVTVNFAKSWSVSTSMDVTVYTKTSFGAAETVPIWKASLSKFILNERGQIKLSAVDLLNKNVGINRSSSYNYLQEQTIKSLGRYVMLSFTWKISKFGSNSNSGTEIRMGGR